MSTQAACVNSGLRLAARSISRGLLRRKWSVGLMPMPIRERGSTALSG